MHIPNSAAPLYMATSHHHHHIPDESNTICNIYAVHIWTDLIRWHTKYSKIYGFYGFASYNFQICNIIPVFGCFNYDISSIKYSTQERIDS